MPEIWLTPPSPLTPHRLLDRKLPLTSPAAQRAQVPRHGDAFPAARTHGVASVECRWMEWRGASVHDGPAGGRNARDVDVWTSDEDGLLIHIDHDFELRHTQDAIPGTATQRHVVIGSEPGPLHIEGGPEHHDRLSREKPFSPRTTRATGCVKRRKRLAGTARDAERDSPALSPEPAAAWSLAFATRARPPAPTAARSAQAP